MSESRMQYSSERRSESRMSYTGGGGGGGGDGGCAGRIGCVVLLVVLGLAGWGVWKLSAWLFG